MDCTGAQASESDDVSWPCKGTLQNTFGFQTPKEIGPQKFSWYDHSLRSTAPSLGRKFFILFFSGYMTTSPPPAHRSLSGTFSDVIPLSILQHESIVDLDIDTSKVSSIVSMSILLFYINNPVCHTKKVIISRFNKITGEVRSRNLAMQFAV
jgi:hypothetical protein